MASELRLLSELTRGRDDRWRPIAGFLSDRGYDERLLGAAMAGASPEFVAPELVGAQLVVEVQHAVIRRVKLTSRRSLREPEKVQHVGGVVDESGAGARADAFEWRDRDDTARDVPRSDDTTVHERDRPEHPVGGDDRCVRSDEVAARLPTVQERIERAQQSRRRQGGREVLALGDLVGDAVEPVRVSPSLTPAHFARSRAVAGACPTR